MSIHLADCPDCKGQLVVLICIGCDKTRVVPARDRYEGQPPAEWHHARKEMCTECLDLLQLDDNALPPLHPPRGMPPSPARNSDPSTSHKAAAKSVARMSSQRMRLLAAYEGAGGLIYGEAALRSGLTEHQAGRRASELLQLAFIEHRGEERIGTTGCMQRVHYITSLGVQALREAV